MIRALLIDLFDTLIFIEEDKYFSWRAEMAHYFGAPKDEFMHLWWSHTSERFRGKIKDVHDMLALAASHFGLELKKEDGEYLAKKELEVFLSISHLYPGTIEALMKMKEEGFLLALVSNATSTARQMIEHMKLSALFNTLVVSCEVGMMKPEEGIYMLALSRLGVAPEECLFIGDGACQELDGAHKVGIRTVRICQTPQTTLFGKSMHFDHEISQLSEVIELAKSL